MSRSNSSKTENKKALAYIIIGLLVLVTFFGIMMFAPIPKNTRALFPVELSFYTRGTTPLLYGDYANYVANNLRDIGLDVKLRPLEYAMFLERVVGNKQYELAIMEFEWSLSPHLEMIFGETASMNIFNYINELDNSSVINLIKQARSELDYETRIGFYEEIQDFLMNKTIPLIPLFTPNKFTVYWNNLIGYETDLGLAHSLPYMFFQNLHHNQVSLTELKLGIREWSTLHPLDNLGEGERIILSIMMDKLIELDGKGEPQNYGLITDWSYLNETTLMLKIRDDVYWQKDYQNTHNDIKFSVEDVIFTLNLLKSPNANNQYELYNWLKSYSKLDDETVIIYIDSDPSTLENVPYAHVLEDLAVYPLPNHFLNTSSSISSIVQSNQWSEYSAYPFGTGKYRMDFNATRTGMTGEFVQFENWHSTGAKTNESSSLEFTKVIVNNYQDAYSMRLALESGEISLGVFGRTPSVTKTLAKEQFVIEATMSNSLIFIAINLENDKFGGERNFINSTDSTLSQGAAVRKALISAINKETVNALNNNAYYITDAPLPKYYRTYYNEEVTEYEHSVTNAINYLALGGYNVTAAGFLADAEPTSLSILGLSGGFVIISTIYSKAIKRKEQNE